MKNAKKLLALLLAVVMCVGLLAGCSNNTGDTSKTPDASQPAESSEPTETYENKVILGSVTDLSGDFRYAGWGASSVGASDQDVGRLTIGYAAQELDDAGEYQWNQTSVESHDMTENEDGTATFTVTIKQGLTFSDGSPITAKNYLVRALAFSTPVAAAAAHPAMVGQAYVGFEDFNAYTGPGSEAGAKEFAGIRLLDEYTYAVTVTTDFYPYYYAYTYANLEPEPLELWLGEGVDIVDDGNGCYLSDSFYEKNGEDYVQAAVMTANRYELGKYPYSGPYTITEWDEGTKQATLTLNPEYQGNWEGQKPSIETIVYVKLVEETQLEQLKTGGVDIVPALSTGDSIKNGLAIVDESEGKFTETHYQRSGYGKIQFDCDFGPTMFQEVRQAVAYLLNRAEFCQNFTGGYGVVVDGPYCPDLGSWQAVQDDIEMIDYSFSPDTAKKVLEEGGWVYNSKGEPYVEGATGVDAVRYKKLTAEEAEGWDKSGVNKTYASVANTDGVTYQTVEINGEYYMPLVINWFGSDGNPVTELLTTMLANSSDVAAAGMVIRATTGDFTLLQGNLYRESSYGYEGTPTYGMYNLATGWPSVITATDFSWNWRLDLAYLTNSNNKLFDDYDKAFPYDEAGEKLTYDQAMEASGGKLGMDYLSMAMMYNTTDEAEMLKWYQAYMERWNELMPDIPLYSNYYYDLYNSKIENFTTSPFQGPAEALLYANVKGH